MKNLKFNISRLVADHIYTNHTTIVDNVKIQFTKTRVNVFTLSESGWDKELSISADTYEYQIVEYILTAIKIQ
jgi:hypothetical protein